MKWCIRWYSRNWRRWREKEEVDSIAEFKWKEVTGDKTGTGKIPRTRLLLSSCVLHLQDVAQAFPTADTPHLLSWLGLEQTHKNEKDLKRPNSTDRGPSAFEVMNIIIIIKIIVMIGSSINYIAEYKGKSLFSQFYYVSKKHDYRHMCVSPDMCWHKQFSGASSSLVLLCGLWVSKWDHQACIVSTSPVEPSCWPNTACFKAGLPNLWVTTLLVVSYQISCVSEISMTIHNTSKNYMYELTTK